MSPVSCVWKSLCLALSYGAGRKWGSSRTFCQVLPSGQEPKLQVLDPGGFHTCKFKNSANSRREKIPHYQKEALVYSWAQGET